MTTRAMTASAVAVTAALAFLLLLPAHAVSAIDWQDWDDAVRDARAEERFLLVLHEERVMSSMWRRGPAFMSADVEERLDADFAWQLIRTFRGITFYSSD